MDIIEYHKIAGPFKRATSGPDKNKVIPWEWSMPEFEVLADIPWIFTEKIDGTNIRIIWDGHRVEIRGRTDRANLAPDLVKNLMEMFPEELMEQAFSANPVILFGEGYGAGIQKGGGNYRKDKSFILFDVYIGGWWLMRDSVIEIAESLGIHVVPIRFTNLTLRQAIQAMADPSVDRMWSKVSEVEEFEAEGVVGTPAVPLFNRKGERIIVKLKGCDLYGLNLDSANTD
jgi:hypothetical protein